MTAGLRPLLAGGAARDTTRLSRRDVVESPLPGLTTIAGGKYTTYRVMAARLVDAAARALGVGGASVTEDVPLLARPGAGAGGADRGAARAGRAAPGGPYLGAEVVHACTHEGALRLEDVLARRTRLALTAPDRGLAAAGPAAALMAQTLGWSEARTRAEVQAWEARIAAERAGEAEPDDDRALAAFTATLADRRQSGDTLASAAKRATRLS